MMKRLILGISALVLATGGSYAGYEWWTVWRFHQTTDNAYLQSDITPISPKVAGHVVEVAVEDNQLVKAGQVLVRIDERDYRAKVEQERANVEAKRAAIANLDSRLALQQTVISQTGADVASAGADRNRARLDLDRSARLAQEAWVSRQVIDSREADAAKADAALRRAAASVEGSRRQLAVLQSERAVAEANLKQAEAALALAEADLENTVLRAPVNGVIGNRGVQLGQYARPGALLLSVVPLDRVWVEANFKETQIGRMRPGMPVEIAVDAFPDSRIMGKVDSFAPASGAKFSLLPPENATGNFTKVVQRIPVKIALPADTPLHGLLRPGMSAVVTVDTGANRDAGLGLTGSALAAGK